MYLITILLFCIVINNYKFINSQEIITFKKNNFISINDIINDDNVNIWIRDLSKINTDSIYIYIDSSGGSVSAGLQFIEIINWYIEQGKKINCIAKSAYSMAFVILQQCTNRYIMSSSIVMQHQISLSGLKGSLNNLVNYIDMIKEIGNNLDNKIALRLNLTVDEYKSKINNDWWLYGKSIIEANVADTIVIVGCDQELYEITTKTEELVFNIDSFGNLELNKIESKKDLCPL